MYFYPTKAYWVTYTYTVNEPYFLPFIYDLNKQYTTGEIGHGFTWGML